MNEEELRRRFRRLLFGVRRSWRYHERRRRFYERVQNLSTFVAFLFGTATVAGVLGAMPEGSPEWLVAVPALLVSFLSGIALVYRVSPKAWLHADLRRRFVDLEAEMESVRGRLDEEALAKLRAQRLAIEADEPPALVVLDALCHNELWRAMGRDSDLLLKVGWFQRLVAQLFDFREHTIQNPAATDTS